MNHLATILGVILGLLLGLLAAVTDINILDRFVEGVSPLGTLFINALQMVVIPLVLLTVFDFLEVCQVTGSVLSTEPLFGKLQFH